MAAVYSLLRLSAAVPAAAAGGMRRFSGKNTKKMVTIADLRSVSFPKRPYIPAGTGSKLVL